MLGYSAVYSFLSLYKNMNEFICLRQTTTLTLGLTFIYSDVLFFVFTPLLTRFITFTFFFFQTRKIPNRYQFVRILKKGRG